MAKESSSGIRNTSHTDRRRNRRSRNAGLWIVLSIALVFVLIGCSTRPEGNLKISSIGEDLVPAGQEIDNDILLTGTDVVVDGKINGDLLAVGNTVTINGPVSGSVVALGQTVVINSEIGGSLYSGAQTLQLGSNAQIDNNAHFLGLLLDTLPGSIVQRDLVAVSLRAQLSAEIGRSLNGFILLMTLSGRIGVTPEEQEVPEIEPTPTGEGSSSLPGARLFGSSQRVFIGTANVNQIGSIAPRLIHQRSNRSEIRGALESDLEEALPKWLLDRLTELAILLPVGLLVLWLIPAVVKRPAEGLRRQPLAATGFGLLGALIAVNIAAIAIFFFVSLLMFGIWLGTVFSWNLTFIAWGVGYPALMLAFALFALGVLYGGKVILADLAGTLILEKLAPKAAISRIVPFLLGIILYIVLRAIPSFGLVFEVVITVLGLGAIWVALRGRSRKMPQTEAEETMIGDTTE